MYVCMMYVCMYVCMYACVYYIERGKCVSVSALLQLLQLWRSSVAALLQLHSLTSKVSHSDYFCRSPTSFGSLFHSRPPALSLSLSLSLSFSLSLFLFLSLFLSLYFSPLLPLPLSRRQGTPLQLLPQTPRHKYPPAVYTSQS